MMMGHQPAATADRTLTVFSSRLLSGHIRRIGWCVPPADSASTDPRQGTKPIPSWVRPAPDRGQLQYECPRSGFWPSQRVDDQTLR